MKDDTSFDWGVHALPEELFPQRCHIPGYPSLGSQANHEV